MEHSESWVALITLLFILTTVSVSYVKFENLPNDNFYRNEENGIGRASTSNHFPRRGLKTINVLSIRNAPPGKPHLAYRALHGLFDRYKRQHGQEQLMREMQQCRDRNSYTGGFGCPELDNRKFLVAYYTCPEQAGNRLHQFINGMIWAVVTNRTLLYDVYDKEICNRIWVYKRGVRSGRCTSLGTMDERIEDCNRALQRADWIPSFHGWKEDLRLDEPSLAYCGRGGQHKEFNVKAVDMLPDRVMSSCYGTMKNAGSALSHFLTSPSDIEIKDLLIKESSIETAHTLLNYDGVRWNGLFDGGWYLYGMLLNEAFSIREHLLPASEEIESGPDIVSIAIHSRHVSDSDDGSNIAEEKICLDHVLKRVRKKKATNKCAVYIMSDRVATVEGLTKESEMLGCRAIRLNQYTGNPENGNVQTSFQKEHGPFDTVDFIRDLAIVSNAEDGLISSSRSTATSTFLLEEMMVYNRRKRGINGGIVTCHLARTK